jgi:hypothetical protein
MCQACLQSIRGYGQKGFGTIAFVMLGYFWPDVSGLIPDYSSYRFWKAGIYNKSFWYKQPDNIKAIRFDIQTPKSDSAIIFQLLIKEKMIQPLRFHAIRKLIWLII